MSKSKEIQNKKLNARLYPIYKMISWDLLFYYSIIYLYLTQTKGFTGSQVLLGEAFFTGSCLFLQIPLGLLVDRFGKKNSLVFANLCMCIFMAILLFANSYTHVLIAFFVDAIGYVIKGICETNILYDSLPRGKKRGHLYSRIDGLGTSRYYIIDAITSLAAGFAFVINPHLPIILCLIINIVATILATRFRHTKMPDDPAEEKTTVRKYFKELKDAIKFSIKSKRMSCLLIFFGIITGLLYNMTTFRSGVLEQIQIPAQYFGVILAVTQIISSLCSRLQNLVHKRFKNKTLTFLGITLTMSCVIIGGLALLGVNTITTIFIIGLFIMQGAIKGAYYVLIYRYLNNFTNRKIRTKLSTIRNIVYNIFSVGISLFGAFLLGITNASNALLIIGVLSTIVIGALLYYMKDKVGLKPEHYSEQDLKYSSFHHKS